MTGKIRVYGTPEAAREGHYFERFRLIEISDDGILAAKGKYTTVFLPWEYLRGYSFDYE